MHVHPRPRSGNDELTRHRLRSEREIVATGQREFPQIFPRPGWVEHDPDEIWATQIAVATEALAHGHLRRATSPPSA